ncbi:MAG: histidinol-phosphate transaminase [Desulfovibrionaceae bacterium]|nr:histidinol-phosphate transaminase [Desulfovibrionaceae bacterium]
MFEDVVRPEIRALEPYVPGRSIDEIRQQYGLERVIKMASNENPLGVSNFVKEALGRHADTVFRYPAGGNPRLVQALARHWNVPAERIAVGNGSDEIIDMLVRMLCTPGRDNVVCFEPCFSLYPLQSLIQGVELRREPVNADFSFDFDKLLSHVDENTRLVFVTTPDNPSGFCPRPDAVKALAERLPEKCLLVIDEAYIDFAPEDGETEADWSLFTRGDLPANACVIRTFSKSYGLAGLRIGVGYLPEELAGYYWRARLPFSVNILAEEAVLAALQDTGFRRCTLETVLEGRRLLTAELAAMGCKVWPSRANFVMFLPPERCPAKKLYQSLLARGIIVRALASYSLPDYIRVSVGNREENRLFLDETRAILEA